MYEISSAVCMTKLLFTDAKTLGQRFGKSRYGSRIQLPPTFGWHIVRAGLSTAISIQAMAAMWRAGSNVSVPTSARSTAVAA
jgi:hypothetical protein